MDAERVMKLHGEGKRYRREFAKEWEEAQQKWDGVLTYQRQRWQSAISVPTAYEYVEGMVAKNMRLMINDRLFAYEENRSEDETRVKKMNIVTEAQDFRVPRRRERWEGFYRYKYAYGIGIGKVWWDDAMGQPMYRQVNPYRFAVEPWTEGLDEASWVTEEFMISKEEALKKFEEGHWSTELSVEKSVEEILRTSGETMEKMPVNVETADMVHVVEYWEDKLYGVVVNGRYLVRMEDNPYEMGMKPYFAVPCVTRQETFWGNGILTPIFGLCDVDSRSMNMLLDYARLKMQPPRWVTHRAGIEAGSTDIMIGKNYFCSAINEISEMKFEGAAEAINNTRAAVKGLKEGATGYGPMASGASAPSNPDTTGGVLYMGDKANERLSLYIEKDEDMLKRLGKMWLLLNMQYRTEEFDIRVKGRERTETLKMRPEDFTKDVAVEVKPPARIVNPQVRSQRATTMMQMLKGMINVDQDALVENYLEANDVKDPDKYLMTKDEQIKRAREAAYIAAMAEKMKMVADMEAQQNVQEMLAEVSEKMPVANEAPLADQPGQLEQPGQATNEAAMAGVPAAGAPV